MNDAAIRKLGEINALLKRASTALEHSKSRLRSNAPPTEKVKKESPKAPGPSAIYLDITKESLEAEAKGNDLTGLVCTFDNAAEMFLALVDDITPYQWQYDELRRLSGYCDLVNKSTPSPEHPLKYLMAAANGSGKDQVIIAAISVWYSCTKKRSRVKITSSSAEQILTQTDPWIRWLFGLLNKYLGRIYNRSVRCYHAITEIGSRVELHVTDDEGKAEGAHPDPGGRLMIIINEAKSVSAEIYRALARCSGYDTWIEVSSPGRDNGRFYEKYQKATSYPAPLTLGEYYCRRITGFDCPHLPESQRLSILEEGGGGETNSLYESSWMANFSSLGEDLIIHSYMVDAISCQLQQTGVKRFGLDIGGGGDPTILYLYNGNERIHKLKFQEKNLSLQIDKLYGCLSQFGYLEAKGAGDHNGLGQGVVDGLRAKGIDIVGLYNQESAINNNEYINLGAELYFNLKGLITNNLLPLPANDPDLRHQLTSRYYKERGNGKKALESKKEYKRRNDGRSPDEADAFVLTFARTSINELRKELNGILPLPTININKYLYPPSFAQAYLKESEKMNQKLTSWDLS